MRQGLFNEAGPHGYGKRGSPERSRNSVFTLHLIEPISFKIKKSKLRISYNVFLSYLLCTPTPRSTTPALLTALCHQVFSPYLSDQIYSANMLLNVWSFLGGNECLTCGYTFKEKWLCLPAAIGWYQLLREGWGFIPTVFMLEFGLRWACTGFDLGSQLLGVYRCRLPYCVQKIINFLYPCTAFDSYIFFCPLFCNDSLSLPMWQYDIDVTSTAKLPAVFYSLHVGCWYLG